MRHTVRAAIAALLLSVPSPSPAQTVASDSELRTIGSSIPKEVLRDLPVGDNVYALLETTQPEVISDRFNSGGLNAGGPSRAGGFLGSWSQTLFRVGDIDVTDPTGTGAALLFPETLPWQTVRVDTGLMPADVNTAGLAVTLDPQRPSARWTRIFGGSAAGGSLTADAPADQPPPIVRLREYGHAYGMVSGPLSERVGLVAAGTWADSSRYDRERAPSERDRLLSGFTNLIFTRTAAQEWRALAWVQRSQRPFASWQPFQDPSALTRDTAVHVQTAWDQHPASGAQWRLFGGLTTRSRAGEFATGCCRVAVERITDGPVPQVLEGAADTTVRRLSAGARFTPANDGGSPHRLQFGADVDVASATTTNAFAGAAQELINGSTARLWTYTNSGGPSDRRATTMSGFATDRIDLSKTVTVDASLRLELVHGRSSGGETAINWFSVLPAARLHWLFAEQRRVALVGGYSRRANALTLDWLAFGDPAAPVATVAAATAPSLLVTRVGPGTGGNNAFSAIDEQLGRPYTDEFVVGLESQRGASTRYTLTGIARREGNLLGVVDTGVPTSSYSTIGIPDAGKDRDNPSDDRILTVFNRLPSSFGRDAYLLTNPGQQAATVFALKLTAEHATERLFILFGATASAAQGSGDNRGYGPLENDQDVPGELFTNPNAQTYARGRLFSDRAFTIKWTTLYRMPRDFSIGAIARYQDGQPFSRLVVVPGLNQGTEAVQAYPNAGSRFTFTGTLDVRVQKGFTVGGTRLDAIFDAYNLFTRSNEVEEYVVTGPRFREPTAIEPPASVHLGVRVTF